jgi:hypothetical protein
MIAAIYARKRDQKHVAQALKAEFRAQLAHFGHRDQSDRSIVITPIGGS